MAVSGNRGGRGSSSGNKGSLERPYNPIPIEPHWVYPPEGDITHIHIGPDSELIGPRLAYTPYTHDEEPNERFDVTVDVNGFRHDHHFRTDADFEIKYASRLTWRNGTDELYVENILAVDEERPNAQPLEQPVRWKDGIIQGIRPGARVFLNSVQQTPPANGEIDIRDLSSLVPLPSPPPPMPPIYECQTDGKHFPETGQVEGSSYIEYSKGQRVIGVYNPRGSNSLKMQDGIISGMKIWETEIYINGKMIRAAGTFLDVDNPPRVKDYRVPRYECQTDGERTFTMVRETKFVKGEEGKEEREIVKESKPDYTVTDASFVQYRKDGTSISVKNTDGTRKLNMREGVITGSQGGSKKVECTYSDMPMLAETDGEVSVEIAVSEVVQGSKIVREEKPRMVISGASYIHYKEGDADVVVTNQANQRTLEMKDLQVTGMQRGDTELLYNGQKVQQMGVSLSLIRSNEQGKGR